MLKTIITVLSATIFLFWSINDIKSKKNEITPTHPDTSEVSDLDVLDSLEPVEIDAGFTEDGNIELAELKEDKPEENDIQNSSASEEKRCSYEMYSIGECDRLSRGEKIPNNRGEKSGGKTSSVQMAKNNPANLPAKETAPNAWAAMTVDKPLILKGSRPNYIGRVIKSRCRVMSLIEDSVVVSDSQRKEYITLNTVGALSGCSDEHIKGLRLGAIASISDNGKWITAKVDSCILDNPNYPTSSCVAVVESISGSDVLEGSIYDKSFFGAIIESAINISGLVMLKDLAGAAAQVDNVWSASTTNAVSQAFQNTLSMAATKVARSFEGREIHLAQGSPVIVTFTEDVEL